MRAGVHFVASLVLNVASRKQEQWQHRHVFEPIFSDPFQKGLQKGTIERSNTGLLDYISMVI